MTIGGGDEQDNFDLSELRGTAATLENKGMGGVDDDLNVLSELVPDLKNRKASPTEHVGMTMEEASSPAVAELEVVEIDTDNKLNNNNNNNDNNTSTSIGILQPDSNNESNDIITEKKGSFVVDDDSTSDDFSTNKNDNDVLYVDDDLHSDRALSSDRDNKSIKQDIVAQDDTTNNNNDTNLGLGDFNNISSGQSLSTATQTHEVRMPMYLPTFKPATGCTNASDFIVRCFVARLRSGITVVKHGRSRWCKSRLRILHIHPDGRSLSWKPAQGEPQSSKRPPKLDLTTCEEVRHAWSPDPQNPMYTGTPILRQKCEAANAHKSFALIFPKRTVDITSVTADQCKVLMEGFSALCFRLQVANLAGKGSKKGTQRMPDEEDHASTTASATLTNNSNQIATSPHNRRQ